MSRLTALTPAARTIGDVLPNIHRQTCRGSGFIRHLTDAMVDARAIRYKSAYERARFPQGIATRFMDEFRRQGYVRYSRWEMVVYPDALKQWLKQGNQSATRTGTPSAQKDPATIVMAATA